MIAPPTKHDNDGPDDDDICTMVRLGMALCLTQTSDNLSRCFTTFLSCKPLLSLWLFREVTLQLPKSFSAPKEDLEIDVLDNLGNPASISDMLCLFFDFLETSSDVSL